MGSLEKARAIVDKLEDARALAKRIAGARYQECVEPWCDAVSALAKAWGCTPLQVVLRVDREGSMPENPLWLFAAAVELTEGKRG